MENKKQDKLNDLINFINSEKKNDEQRMSSITTTLDYVNWLEDYTNKTHLFTNHQYFTENCVNQDLLNKVAGIEYLFLAIDNFAKNNYVEPYELATGNYYVFEYNNVKYRIGFGCANTKYYFCERLLVDTQEKAIQIENVIYNLPLENTLLINNLLSSLKHNLDSLVSLGVKKETIQNVIDESLTQKPKIRNRVK